MGILQTLGLGKKEYTLTDLYNVLRVFEEEIKIVKEKKQKWREEQLKERMFKLLKDLKQEGIVFEFDKEDGGGALRKRIWMKFGLDKCFKQVVNTVNEIEKEVDRRRKEDGKKRENKNNKKDN